MAKMTLEELRKLRNETQNEMQRRETDGKSVQIIVGMGTCGISAGAKASLDAFIAILKEKNLAHRTIIRQTGCMGLCANEPTVEVIAPGMPKVIYGKVTPDVTKEIVEKHIIGKTLLDKLVLDYPAIDIVKK